MKNKKKLTFDDMINLGEYDPQVLSKYEEWDEFSPYTQLQYIKKGIDNRRDRLTTQMAELYNVLDLRLKPEVQKAIDNLHEHLRKIEKDREKYFIEYSEKI